MAYRQKQIYELAKEFGCSEQELIDFARSLGLPAAFRLSVVNEYVYNKAKNYFSKPAQKIYKPSPAEVPEQKISVTVDYRTLLKKYDAEELKLSPTKYFEAVRSVVDELLDILQRNESAQAKTLAELSQLALKLKAKFNDSPHLTPEENSLLAERQKFLADKLSIDTAKVKSRLLSAKTQAEKFSMRLEEIYDGNDLFCELAALEVEPRPSFAFLVECLAQIVQDALDKQKFLASNQKFISSVAKIQADWSVAYKAFKTSLREELIIICRKDGIDGENFSAWYEDWQTKRLAIEQRFLPLVEFGLKRNLLDLIERVLAILQSYRDAVDKFYLHERKNIYQKFAFTRGGDLQEKFETESELYKLTEKFRRDLQEIIFSSGTEERIFLLRWSEPLLNQPIDALSEFIRDRKLNAISEEVLRQFAALRQKNFAEYLADGKAYGEAVNQREKEFNALIFRMRKDLAR